ncbi:UNVERIFIED_CONTAM: hypothetical protein HDU68_010304 [Siphonaria sp. JEL0065]|nr:hypothetical protein HDU68_010304 [Siphonaria sp. JEL0065]
MSAYRDELRSSVYRAEKILNHILPKHVMETMKQEQTTAQEEYACVTIVFTDVTNFQRMCNETTATDMMVTMERLWAEYDILCLKWNVQRVQTVNDQFLGAVGIPDRQSDHAEQAAHFAMDLIKMARDFRTETGERMLIRVGLNSGPVTAGLVGEVNPQWTIIGDAVNVSSRMESTSQAMRIHMTEATYNLIFDKGFMIEGPDVIEVKGKGKMVTYWIAE